MTGEPVGLSRVLDILGGYRFCWATEDELQRGLSAAFAEAGAKVEREVRLSLHDRVDLLVGRVGIEVKVAGSWRDLHRQVLRYVASDRLDAVVVVTSKVGHTRLPARLGNKPVVVHLVGSTL